MKRYLNRLLPAKRFLLDALGNYLFFCPLVILFNHWWDKPEVMVPYLISSVPLAAVGGRLFTVFLLKCWYPLWRIVP